MTVQTNQPDLKQWRYRPEFIIDEQGNIRRVDSPAFVHPSGAVVDLTTTKSTIADMLDAEGRTGEAAALRRIARGGG